MIQAGVSLEQSRAEQQCRHVAPTNLYSKVGTSDAARPQQRCCLVSDMGSPASPTAPSKHPSTVDLAFQHCAPAQLYKPIRDGHTCPFSSVLDITDTRLYSALPWRVVVPSPASYRPLMRSTWSNSRLSSSIVVSYLQHWWLSVSYPFIPRSHLLNTSCSTRTDLKIDRLGE